MRQKFNRVLAAVMALILVFSMVPAVAAAQTTELTPDQYKYYAYNGGGDPLYQATWGLSTPEGVDDYMTFIQELGFCRVNWRGLEWAILGNQIDKRPEFSQVMAPRAAIYAECYGLGNNFDDPTTEKIENVDTYAVQKAHELGLSIVGVTGISIFGGNGDVPVAGYPYTYVSLQNQNGISGPLDQYGYEEKGGSIDYSNERARELAINAIMAEVTDAGYDGVHFITYTESYQLRYDDQFGYSDVAIAEFEKRYGFAPGYGNFDAFGSQEDWRRLQGEYFTEFLREMKDALRAYNDDAILGINVDSRRPRYLEQWASYGTADSTMIGDGIFQDFETWSQDNIVDELHVRGSNHWTTQMRVIDDLLWLTRGTNTQVVIYTSTAWYEGWEQYQKMGVPVLLNNNANGEQNYYRYGPVVDSNRLTTDDAKLRYKLYQIIDGGRSATIEEVLSYLDHEGVIIPRMAMTALVTRYTNDPRTVEALNRMVTHESSDLRAWAIRELIGKSNGNQVIMNADSVTAILEALKMDMSQSVHDNAALALAKVTGQAEYQQLMWDAFTDPDSSLSEKAVAIRGLSATTFYASEEVAEKLIEVIEGDEMEVSPNAPQIPENSYKDWIRYYSVARLGISAIYSQKARDKLLEYVACEDTVVANEALTVLKGRASSYTGSDKTKAITVLKSFFENLSPDSGVTYATDFKDWAYRPAGEALLAFGDEGKAILLEFYNGDDAVLAEYAWKCLYMPQNVTSTNIMTEEAYYAIYDAAPAALTSYSEIKLSQDFENRDLFNETCNIPAGTSKNIGTPSGTAGQWFVNGGTHVEDHVAHTGSQSFALTTGIAGPYTRITVKNGIENGANYMVSLWVMRQEGAGFNIITTDNATNVMSSQNKDFLLRVRNTDGAAFLDDQNTNLTVPANVWTRIDIEIRRANAVNQGIVTIHPENGTEASSQPISITPYNNLTRIILYHNSASSGGSVWFDDIVWAQSSPARKNSAVSAITMESAGINYDGQPHSLTAVTAPAGQRVSYTYVDSEGNTLDGEPVNAGIYTVTAEIADGEHQGAKATATLTIRKAPVSVVEVTAGNIDVGMPLSVSQLNITVTAAGSGELLEGIVSWDMPGTYPITSGAHTWTFAPTNPNYQSVSGTAQVTLNANKLKYSPVLSQNFDDTSVFNASTHGSAVAVGGIGGKTWGPIYSQIGREGAANILALSDDLLDTDPGEVNAIYVNAMTTGSGYAYTRGTLETSVSAAEDYQISFKVYRRSENESILRIAPTGYDCALEVHPDGSITMKQSNQTYTAVPDVTVPLATWTTITITAHRESKTVDLTVASAGETAVTVLNAGVASNNEVTNFTLYNMSKTSGSTPLVDDIIISVQVPDQSGYYVGITPTAEALIGEKVYVDLNMISAEQTIFNAYAFTVSYDKDILSFVGITEGFTVDADTEKGILTITGSGTELPVNSAITLIFTASTRGTAEVKLSDALISNTEQLDEGQTSVEYDTCSVLVDGYTVDLPEDFEGDAAVAEGSSYTFTAKNPNYDYSFEGSAMGGVSACVTDNGDGTFSVKSVSADLVIVSQKTAKRFTVSVEGNAKDAVTAGNPAIYGENYSFFIDMTEDYTYSVYVTVNGKVYAPDKNGTTYTIEAIDIVGDIVITVTKTFIPTVTLPKPSISLTLNESIDMNFYLKKADIGEDFTLVVKRNGEVLEEGRYTLTETADGRYRIRVSINADKMCDEITVQAFDLEGKAISQERTESVRSYAKLRLANANAPVEEKAALIRMLDYGSLAQMAVAGGEVADLANSVLTAEERALLDGITFPEATAAADAAVGTKAGSKFSVSLTANETIDVNLYIAQSDMKDGYTIQVKRGGTVLAADQYSQVETADGRIRVRVSVNADKMNDVIEVQVMKADGTAAFDPRSLSVRHFVTMRLNNASASATEKAMMIALADYGTLVQMAAAAKSGKPVTDPTNRYITAEQRAQYDYKWN